MKKILICLLLSVCFASCNSEKKIIVSEVPIKTNVIGIEMGQKVDIDCTHTGWIEPIFVAGGLVFTPSFEQITPNIVSYMCWPKLKDYYYYGGFRWSYLTLVTVKNNIVFDITLACSYGTIEEAKTQYGNVLQKLSEIYGKGNIIQNGTMWTDMVNYITLNYCEDKAENGSIRGFCELRYRNIELEKEMAKEVNDEF